jgi:hypothetical protein
MERLREILRAPAGTRVRLTIAAEGLARQFILTLSDYE